MSDEIGELIKEKMSVEWRVPDFFSLPPEVGKKFVSPVFFFAGLVWEFWLYPNGEIENSLRGGVMLFLTWRSKGLPKTVSFSVGLRKANGEEEVVFSKFSNIIDFTKLLQCGLGGKLLERSDLLKRKDQLAPADTLTVTCSLGVEDGNISDDSFTSRLWNLSLNLATLMSTREDADVTLELPDGKLKAHKMILKSRSPVLGSMFSHDMKECQTGEVKIEDADTESFEIVLAYIYTGDPKGLTSKNAKDVYRISQKYDLRDLTRCCSEFLRTGLRVDTICDVITIAVLYQDQKLMDSAKDYFVGHKDEITKTDQWKTLKKENAKIVCEMLEYTLNKIC